MNLASAIEDVRRNEKVLILYNPVDYPDLEAALREYFHAHNVRIRCITTDSTEPRNTALLNSREELLATVDCATLDQLVRDVPTSESGFGIADSAYQDVLRHLKETTFTSRDTRELLYTAREIEDRARRVGQGTLHAGFQHVSRMVDQQGIYSDLARRGLTVHTYGVPDTTPPDLGSATVHPVETDEIAAHWFVVFDGGGHPNQLTALVAAQQIENEFYGMWTYDPWIVRRLCAYIERMYVLGQGDVAPRRE